MKKYLIIFMSIFGSLLFGEIDKSMIQEAIDAWADAVEHHDFAIISSYISDNYIVIDKPYNNSDGSFGKAVVDIPLEIKKYKIKKYSADGEIKAEVEIHKKDGTKKEITFTFDDEYKIKNLSYIQFYAQKVEMKKSRVICDKDYFVAQMDFYDGIPVVEVGVNGLKYDFILDFGAEEIVVDNKVLNSEISQNGKVHVKSLIFGLIQKNETDFENRDLSNYSQKMGLTIAGLMNYNELSKYILSWDFTKKYIYAVVPNEKGEPSFHVNIGAPNRPVSLERYKQFPMITCTINGKDYKFLIDSGSRATVVSQDIREEMIPFFIPSGEDHLITTDGRKIPVEAGKLYRISVGKNWYNDLEATFVNLKELNPNFDSEISGIFGTDFLNKRLLQFNNSKKLMYFLY